MSATVLQIRGQKLYREKNYEAALEAFNSAIRLSSQSTISILDNRAAAHEKLGDFQAALRDGKRIIDQQKSEARGYLRVGKVLQLMEKEELARNIYQRGASNVAPNDPQYKLLMAMLEKVSGNLRSTATNPLLVLPPELLEMIALQLDFKSLTACTRVSKEWRLYFESMGSLWANLDFSGARRPLRYYQLRVCMKRAQGRTIQATLNRHALSLSKVLGTLMSECGTLEHLTILDDVDLKTIYNDLLSAKDLTTLLIPNCMVPLDAVMSILRASHRLVRAEFGGICRANMGSLWPERLDNLRTLKLNAMRPLGGQLRNLRGFLSMMPNITKLAMTKFNYLKIPVDPQPDYSTLKFLEHIDLSDSGLPSSVPLPASIRHVFLNGVPDMELPRLMGEEAESTNLKFLETLEVGHNIDMKARMLIPILDPSRGVRKRVSLFRCISIYDEDIRELAESGILEDIEHLNLGETGVRDDGIAFIANAAPNLIRLNLSSTGVSGVGVKALLSRPDSKLACLNLDGCMSVNIDAVEWARSKGVHVQFQFVEKAGSGKKVRYG